MRKTLKSIIPDSENLSDYQLVQECKYFFYIKMIKATEEVPLLIYGYIVNDNRWMDFMHKLKEVYPTNQEIIDQLVRILNQFKKVRPTKEEIQKINKILKREIKEQQLKKILELTLGSIALDLSMIWHEDFLADLLTEKFVKGM